MTGEAPTALPQGAPLAPCAPAPDAGLFTLANAVTLAGAAATALWLQGGSPAFAVAGLVADELDDRIARARGTAGPTASHVDDVADVSLNAIMLDRLNAAWAIPLAVPIQVVGKREGVGSLRVALTAALLYRQWRSGRARPNPPRKAPASHAKSRRTR